MTSILKDTRERAGLAIEDVARQLKIRRQYLIALEEEKLDEIPGEVYAQGYMRMYATYLGIDPDECKIFTPSDGKVSFWLHHSDHLSRFDTKKVVISLFILGVLCIFCWYSLTDEINVHSGATVMDRLNQYNLDDGGSLPINYDLMETALGRIPTEGNK
jgi:cytoskeletal protein RodZ